MKTKASWLWSGARLVAALGIAVGFAVSVGGAGGCAVAPDEPAASDLETPFVEVQVPVSTAGFQVVFVCFDPSGNQIGLPKSPLSACQAACPAGDSCQRCVLQNNAVDCG
jgi:hypothetical protein